MKRLVTTFRKFDSTANAAIKSFKEVKMELKNEYGDSRAFEKQYGEAKDILDETMARAKEEALQEIDEIFAEVAEKVQNFAMQTPPADFAVTLDAIKAMGENVTEKEAELYFDKYRNNYTAARGLSNYLHNLKGYLLPIPAFDRIMEELEADRTNARAFVIDYKTDSYTTALYITDKSNPWEAEAEKLQKFLAGDVSVIAEPIENK